MAKNEEKTKYTLKLDISKFYQSIDKDILKSLLRRKIKDNKVLELLDEIIDSYPQGLPLGHYLSQTLSNFYLTYFDHFVKEKLRVKYYMRYSDDMVLLSDNKQDLHFCRAEIENYLRTNLKLEIKRNSSVSNQCKSN